MKRLVTSEAIAALIATGAALPKERIATAATKPEPKVIDRRKRSGFKDIMKQIRRGR